MKKLNELKNFIDIQTLTQAFNVKDKGDKEKANQRNPLYKVNFS